MRCANCGSERLTRYCANCGQNDREYRRALPPLLSELLRETFEVDSRLWRTLKLLVFKPGELALEFSRNRRASYVSPIRLYLFVSIVFFFLLSLTAEVTTPDGDETVRLEVEGARDTDTTRLVDLLSPERQQRAREILARPDTAFSKLLLLEVARSVSGDDTFTRTEAYLVGQIIDVLHEPESVAGQFLDNLAVGVFVMLPVYAALLKLFYLGHHRYYVEHLVFSTHLHTFSFLVFTVALLLPEGDADGWLATLVSQTYTALLLWLGVYHYLALRRYFDQGRVLTFVKFVGLMSVYTALLMPTAFVLVFAVTVLSF